MPFRLIHINPEKEAQWTSIVLDGRRFYIYFYYVIRTRSWYIHLETSSRVRLVSGWRLTALYPITDQSDRRRWARGYLTVISNTSHTLQDPERESLETTHFLAYLPFSELGETITAVQVNEDG